MTWQYRLCKQKSDDETIYSVREVYLNKDESIWGYTSCTNPLEWVEDEKDTTDEIIKKDIKKTLLHLLLDVGAEPVLDLDTLETVEPDFLDEEMKEIIRSDN
tara:strand:+ start:563 stop:868 length:306 start_codon:yes stop_codon:yes gene_type:complete